MTSVLLVRLKSGMEFIGEVEQVEDKLVVNNPISLMETHQGVAMVPFAPLSKDTKLTLPYGEVLFTAAPLDNILEAYQQRFGGIVTPPAKALVLP